MPRVTLDIDDETLERMRTAAESAGVSMSTWLVQLVRERTQMQWPNDIAALAGAWHDLPTAEELRQGPPDDPREAL